MSGGGSRGGGSRRRPSRKAPDLGLMLGDEARKKGWGVNVKKMLAAARATRADGDEGQESRREAGGPRLDPAMIWSLRRRRR